MGGGGAVYVSLTMLHTEVGQDADLGDLNEVCRLPRLGGDERTGEGESGSQRAEHTHENRGRGIPC